MKLSFLLIAMVVAALPWRVAAQSAVTLFGAADLGGRWVDNGSAGTIRSLARDGYTASKIGLRGIEDIGSGLYAGFRVEASAKPDIGGQDDSRFFGRRSTVSLASPLGELRLGRDKVPSYLNTQDFDPFGGYGVASADNLTKATNALLGSGIDTIERSDNAVFYMLPSNPAGIYGEAMAAAGESMPGRRYTGGRIGWKSGPIDAAVGYGKTATATAENFFQTNIGAGYDFGSVKLMGFYDVHLYAGSRQNTWAFGATASFGNSVLRVSCLSSRRSGGAGGSGYADGDDSQQMALGGVYKLSQRTELYATVSRIVNRGGAKAVVTGGMAPDTMRGGEKSTGAELGLATSF